MAERAARTVEGTQLLADATFAKIRKTMIPVFDVKNAAQPDVLSYLAELSRENDPGVAPNPGKGLVFKTAEHCCFMYDPMFSLRIENASFLDVIKCICTLSGAKWRVGDGIVFLSGGLELSEQPDGAVTQESAPSAAP